MAFLECPGLPGCLELFQGIVAQGEQKPEAQGGVIRGGWLHALHHALVEQVEQLFQHRFAFLGRGWCNRFGCRQCKFPDKDAQPSKELLGDRIEQVVAPINGLAQGALARRQAMLRPHQ